MNTVESIPPILREVLKKIAPPDRITDFEGLTKVLQDPDRYTLIEFDFFPKLFAVMSRLARTGLNGDVLAVGIWRGGSALYLKVAMHYLGLSGNLYLCDTFNGFNESTITNQKDIKMLKMFKGLAAPMPSKSETESLLRQFGLLDDKVMFLEGDVAKFENAIDSPLLLSHIDVDFYRPTYDALSLTMKNLQKGGAIIIDDYGVDDFGCKDAVHDFFLDPNWGIQIPEAIQMLGLYPGLIIYE